MDTIDDQYHINEIMLSKKICELKEIIKVYNIRTKSTLKSDLADSLAKHTCDNIELIIEEMIIYEELLLLQELCNKNYKLHYNNKVNESAVKSLGFLGIIKFNKESSEIGIPIELQSIIHNKIENKCVLKKARDRQNIIDISKIILDIYGIIPFTLIEKYITLYEYDEYKAHKILTMLWQYNQRYELFSEDLNSNYCSLNIIDKEYIHKKINELNMGYRYYDLEELENVYKCACILSKVEREIYVILNRYYKDKEKSLNELRKIKFMIKNGYSSSLISEKVSKDINIKSEIGKRNLQVLIEQTMEKCPLWTLKGHFPKEIKNKLQ